LGRSLKRFIGELGLAALLLVAVAVAVWMVRLPLLGGVLTRQVQAHGFPQAVVRLERFDLTGVDGTIRLSPDEPAQQGRIALRYSVQQLLAGRLESMSASDLVLPGRVGADGTVTVAGMTVWQSDDAPGDLDARGRIPDGGGITGIPIPSELPIGAATLSNVLLRLETPVGPVALGVDARLTPAAAPADGVTASGTLTVDHTAARLAVQVGLSLTAQAEGRGDLEIIEAWSRHPALEVDQMTGRGSVVRPRQGPLGYQLTLAAGSVSIPGLPPLASPALTLHGEGPRHSGALQVTAPELETQLSARIAVEPPDAAAAGQHGDASWLTTDLDLKTQRLDALVAAVLNADGTEPVQGGRGALQLSLAGRAPEFPPRDLAGLAALTLVGPLDLRLEAVGVPDLNGEIAVDTTMAASLSDGVLSLRPRDCLSLQVNQVGLAGYRLERATRWCVRLLEKDSPTPDDAAVAVRFYPATFTLSVPDVRLDLTDPPRTWSLTPVQAGRPQIRLDRVRDTSVQLALAPGLGIRTVHFDVGAARFALPDIGVSGGNLGVDGRWSRRLQPILSVVVHAGGLRTEQSPAPVVPLAVDLAVQGDPAAALEVSGWALGAPGEPKARLAVRHDARSGRGSLDVQLEPQRFGEGGLPAEVLFPVLASYVRAVTGRVEGHLDYSWGARGAGGSAHLLFDNVAFDSDLGRVEALNGPIALRSLTPPATDGWQTVAVGLFNPGLPLTNGVARFRLSEDGRLGVNRLNWDWADGRLRAFPFDVSLTRPEGRFEVLARGLSLREILALTPFEGLSATGRLDGQLPVMIEGDDLRIADGQLTTTAPGRIRYEGGGDAAALRRSLTSFDLNTLKAVFSDFRYDQLSLSLDGRVGGEMIAKIRVSGANPEFQGGRPVRLNLNLSGKLVSILRQSLRVYRIPEEVRQRMMEYRQQQRRE